MNEIIYMPAMFITFSSKFIECFEKEIKVIFVSYTCKYGKRPASFITLHLMENNNKLA